VECPVCESESTSRRCECGFDFETRSVEGAIAKVKEEAAAAKTRERRAKALSILGMVAVIGIAFMGSLTLTIAVAAILVASSLVSMVVEWRQQWDRAKRLTAARELKQLPEARMIERDQVSARLARRSRTCGWYRRA